MDKLINWELVMHFWVNVFYVLNVIAGAAVIELAARGMRWIGADDLRGARRAIRAEIRRDERAWQREQEREQEQRR
jgi:cobalamin biosynthesis protein CobD/CbiB